MEEEFAASFPFIFSVHFFILVFGPAQKKAKVPQYRLRRPQASSVTPLNTTQYFPAISRAHLPHKLQAVQETSQP